MALPPRFLVGVVGTCPEGMVDGLGGILDEALPQELRAEVAPSRPAGLAAALDHGRDA